MKRKFAILPENKLLGQQLKDFLQKNNLAPALFSRVINVPTNQLEKYLQGIDRIPVPIIATIAEKYDIYIPQKTLRKIVALRDNDDSAGLLEMYHDLWNHRLGD